MKSWPHPYFWKWKIKVQKSKLSVSGVCWKLKIKMAQEMKTAVLSVCSKKKNLNYKIKTSRRERSTGKVQNRDVRDENLRVWGFVVCLCNIGSELAHMRGVICSGKVQNRDVWGEKIRIEVCSVSWDVGSGWVGTHAWKTGMCEMNFSDLKFVVCLGTLVQDGFAHGTLLESLFDADGIDWCGGCLTLVAY